MKIINIGNSKIWFLPKNYTIKILPVIGTNLRTIMRYDVYNNFHYEIHSRKVSLNIYYE